MVFCFFCYKELCGKGTQVCSSTTPHSNVSCPEAIEKPMKDKFLIIVKPTDQLCKNCISLLIRIDKIKYSIELIKNTFLSYSQNKYGTLPPVQTVNSVKQQKKQIYICEVCSKKFDSPINCLDHISKDHNLPTPSTSNEERETEDSRQVTTRVMKPESSMTQENIPLVECIVIEGKKLQDYNKVSFDKYMLLTDNSFNHESADAKKRKRN